MQRSGRSPTSLRPVSIILETLERVDGSAAFAFGDAKALASVSGPIHVRLTTELPSKAYFEVIVRPLSGVPGTESKALGAVLRSLLTPSLVLTQNPRTMIQLVVQLLTPTLSNPGPSLVAASINASSIALIRTSSFPMLGVVCAAAVGRDKEPSGNRILLLDPTEEEMTYCDATGCVAVMFGYSRTNSAKMDEEGSDGGEGEVVWSSFQGSPLQDDYDALLRLAKSGAFSVYETLRERLNAVMEIPMIDTTETKLKKMPKQKGGRVVLDTGVEDSMDVT